MALTRATLLRLLRAVANIALVALLLGAAFLLVAPRLWGLEVRSVASGSMEPTIPVGAVVAVLPVDAVFIRPGDVITYKSPENPTTVVTHRVVAVVKGKRSSSFYTQGDANPEPDLDPVPESSVLGRVVVSLPWVGYVAQFARTRRGWLLLIVVPAGLIVLMEVVSIIRAIWTADEHSPEKAKGAG